MRPLQGWGSNSSRGQGAWRNSAGQQLQVEGGAVYIDGVKAAYPITVHADPVGAQWEQWSVDLALTFEREWRSVVRWLLVQLQQSALAAVSLMERRRNAWGDTAVFAR